jgi:glycosyltransferase involved in cell wall biosynthesis
MRVTQVLCAAGPVDAVTNQALSCRALFRSWGWDGEDFSAVIAPGMPRGAMRPLGELKPAGGEVLLLHYSGYARGLEPLFELRRRSLLISHNITPARYFWAHDPVEGVRCELGQGQLAWLAGGVGTLAGVSQFNARELRALSGREADVIPVLFDRAALPAARADADPQGPPTILFVGRLAPHKRQDLVIGAFARYRRLRSDARLVLVGVPSTPEFGAWLQRVAAELAPGSVTFESGISRERLAEHYRAAHAFLCLSEHEGFCIPLLEAFHFGVPVIARDEGAVGEVVGDAGVLLGPGDELEVVAELLRIVAEDAELRGSLHARGEARLAQYTYERTAGRLREALLQVAA